MLAAGCASRGSVRRLQADVTRFRGDLAEARKTQQATAADLARVTAESRPMAARTLEVEAAQRESTAEVVRLWARLDALEAEMRQARTATAAPVPAVAPPTPVAPAPPAPRHSTGPPAQAPAPPSYWAKT